jgi:uncharacterized protein YndB with AHSA1/START domain
MEPTKDFIVEKMLTASPEIAFLAWTNPALVAKWWSPFPEVVAVVDVWDTTPGGQGHISVQPPWGGEPFQFYLKFITVDAPKEISFTVRAEPTGSESPIMKATFASEGAGTRMTFISPNIPVSHYEDATRGWIAFFDKLEKHFAS